MRRLGGALILFATLALVGCDRKPRPEVHDQGSLKAPAVIGVQPAIKTFDTFSELQAELATRVRTEMHVPPDAVDFQVIRYEGAQYPVGTIMWQGGSRPIDFDACAPEKPHDPFPFTPLPFYRLKRSVAGEAGLDEGLVSQIADAGIKISADQDIQISIKNTKMQILADNQVNSLLATPQCAQAVGAKPVWFVRGYLIGERTFSAASTMSADARVKVTKVANFDVNPAGSSSVGITDSSPVAFIMIVSEVTPKPPVHAVDHGRTPASAPPASHGPSTVAGLTAPAKKALVYVQVDKADTTSDVPGLLRELQALQARTHGVPVAKGVQHIATAAMPKTAQIRYFNDEDKAVADQALAILKARYKDARIARMALPAPKGQYEVWLPQAASRPS